MVKNIAKKNIDELVAYRHFFPVVQIFHIDKIISKHIDKQINK